MAPTSLLVWTPTALHGERKESEAAIEALSLSPVYVVVVPRQWLVVQRTLALSVRWFGG